MRIRSTLTSYLNRYFNSVLALCVREAARDNIAERRPVQVPSQPYMESMNTHRLQMTSTTQTTVASL